MNLRELEELINTLCTYDNPEQINKASETLYIFLLDPQSIFLIFQYLDEVYKINNQRNIMFSFNLIRNYMKSNYKNISLDLQNQIFDKLISYINLNLNEHTSILSSILHPMIKNNEQRISSILDIINSMNTQDIPSKFSLLLLILSNLNKYSPLLLKNKKIFIDALQISLSQDNEQTIVLQLRLYFLSIEKELINSDEFSSLLVNYIEHFYYNESIWSIFSKNVSKNLIPEECLNKLYEFALKTVSNGDFQLAAFNFILKCINHINKVDFTHFMNIFNEYAGQYLEDTCFKDVKSSFNQISKYLLNHPIQNIYDLLKQYVDQAQMVNPALSFSYYYIIFRVSWNEFISDIDSFFEKISLSINDDEQVKNIIYFLLEDLVSNYLLDDFYSMKFIKEIANSIYADNALKAIDSMVNQLTCPFPNLFEILLQFSTEQCDDHQLIPILTNLINCDENVDPYKLKMIANTILPQFENSSYFPLAVILMKRNKELIDLLLPQSLYILQKNPKYKINFINCIYEYFGYLFDPQFESIVKEVQKIIIDYCKGNKLINNTTLLNLCSTFSKHTKDNKLATELEKQIIKFLLNYDKNAENIDDEYDKEEYDNDDEEYDNNDGYDKEKYDDDDDNDDDEYDVENVCYSCKDIIKLLDKIELRKMLFHINLHINNTSNIKIAELLLSVMTKLLRHSCDEDKKVYLDKCNNVLDKIFKGKLKALNGQDILSSTPRFINEVGLLIFEVVRYQSPYVETISNFLLKVLKTCKKQFYYFTYVSACYYLIENKTGTPKVIQEIIDLVPMMIKDTNLISLKQNIAFLFVPMIQYDETTFKKLTQFVPILHDWFLNEKQNEYVHCELISTISLAFLTFFANGMTIDIKLLNESINEFPPKDKKDTSSMINKIIKIFSSNKLDSSCIQIAAFALSKLFLLDDRDLEKRKVSQELMNSAHKLFISFSNSNPEIWTFLHEKYMNSEEIIDKLKKIV